MTLTAPSKAPATIDTVIDSVDRAADEVVTLVLHVVPMVLTSCLGPEHMLTCTSKTV